MKKEKINQNANALLQTDKIAMDLALSAEQYNKVQSEKQKQEEQRIIFKKFYQ